MRKSIFVLIFLFFFVFTGYFILIYLKFDLNIKPASIPKQQCEPFVNKTDSFKIVLDNVEYPQSIPLYLNKSINFECLNSQERIPKILFWNSFFGDVKFAFGVGYKQPFVNNNCPVYNCEMLNDKSRINEADFVIVHMRDRIQKFPSNRPSNQRWIFALFESPANSVDFRQYNGLFNFTSTYRIESEFPRLTGSYKLFEWGKNETYDEHRDFSHGKSFFAAAVIGNCGASSGRLELIKSLQKYLPVTVLGKCGIKCTHFFKNSSNSQCKELISKNFKFYFSFENSICNGYISEKFFQVLRYDIIPVVFGGGNYSYFVPKSGFINVLDFKNIKELAGYLIYLNGNKTAYNAYFKWKKYALFNDRLVFSMFCDMCIQLNLENYGNIWRNTIENIGAFWSKKENCKRPKFDQMDNFEFKNF